MLGVTEELKLVAGGFLFNEAAGARVGVPLRRDFMVRIGPEFGVRLLGEADVGTRRTNQHARY